MMGSLKRIPTGVWAIGLVVVPHLLFALSLWHSVPTDGTAPTGPRDPDSWLRLTLVRDWVQGGGWYNHLVANSNAPLGGTISPWTRPLDMVIAAITHLQPSSVDLSIRLARTALLLPVLWMALLLAGVHRLVRLLTPLRSALVLASILTASTPMMWNYFGTGNADHHAPLAVLFIWALGLLFTPAPSRWLVMLSGILLGVQLWISVEALILIGAIYGWYGIQWLRGENRAMHTLAALATSIAFTTLAALLIEHPASQWAVPLYDTISIVYVFILALAACLAWLLMLVHGVSFHRRMAWALFGSALLVACVRRIYPLMLHGPLVGVDPFIFTDFLPHVVEALPLWKSSLPLILGMLVQPVAALAICALAWLSPRSAFYGKQQAALLCYLLGFTTALFIGQVRWCYYLYPLAAVALAPFFAALLTPYENCVKDRWPATWILRLTPAGQALRRIPILVFSVTLPVVLVLLSARYEALLNGNAETEGMKRSRACKQSVRQIVHNGALARATGNTSRIIFTSTDVGAQILYWTKLRIIASNYHREGAGIRFIWSAYDITDMQVLRTHLAQRDVDYVLICPLPKPVKGSVLQALAEGGRAPAWLRPIPYEPPAHDGGNDAAPALFRVRH